jgi:uncharacterized damage-inducible protein DinB
MKQRIRALRYLISALAVSAAFSLVCFAQQAAGGQQKSAAAPAQAAPAREWPGDPVGMLVAEWTRARNWTQAYIDKMPEDGLSFKPTPEIRSFTEQMLHLASANYFFAVAATGQTTTFKREDFAVDKIKTKADLSKMVLGSYDFMISGIKAMDAAKLDEKLTRGNTTMTRTALLHNSFEHQTHHRGQTTIYLRLKGAVPPPEPFQ